MTTRIAIAAHGELAKQIKPMARFGVDVITYQTPVTGQRWDVIIVLPLESESRIDLFVWREWATEVLPTKLRPGGLLIPAEDLAWRVA